MTRFTAYRLSTVISIVSTLANERLDATFLIAAKSNRAEASRRDRRCYDRVPCTRLRRLRPR